MKTNLRFSYVVAITVLIFIGISSTAVDAQDGFKWKNLVSDIPGVAQRVDSHVVNPWGIVPSPTNTIWIANNGTGTSTLYNTDGIPVPEGNPLVVAIPSSSNNTEGANPTGVVFNGGTEFVVSENATSGPSLFIFVSEDGSISGWSPTVALDHAILAVDHPSREPIYKGAALGTTAAGARLYVTNFHAAKVEIYNGNFKRVDTANTFVDANIPRGFAPFGIRNINGLIYVTYAKQDADREDDVAGSGLGFVSVFSADGDFIKRLISRDHLNAPWGLALTPSSFGKFHNALLVGNFGNGHINAFDPNSGAFLGRLDQADGTPLAFEGLWGLHFIGKNLFFTAGIVDEEHGLFGVIREDKNGQ